ncbi:MAG: histidine kinase [Bacteroidetes bacterium]|nr:histidine kinase [Bacteroidota bacterium]
MKLENKRLTSDLLFRVLFHLLFWFYWLLLPILNSIMDNDTHRLELLTSILPANLLSLPFFYINTEILIKRFFSKNQLTRYFLSLLVLFVVYLILYVLLKDYLMDKYPVKVYDSRTLFPVVFIISMSTLYGVIVIMVNQSKKDSEEKEEKLKSELSFLRSQISPHFIFNVLNSIVYLIRTKSDRAENVTIELSNLIRYMLYESENKQVLLEKEIEYLKNYIELQKIRFGDDVNINLKIEGTPGTLFIEPMLLIPFVENAFKHGVGFIKNPEIDIWLNITSPNNFRFKVSNKIGPEKENQKDSNSGIGLKNVKRRIELLYPESNNLKVKNNDAVFEIDLSLGLKTINQNDR